MNFERIKKAICKPALLCVFLFFNPYWQSINFIKTICVSVFCCVGPFRLPPSNFIGCCILSVGCSSFVDAWCLSGYSNTLGFAEKYMRQLLVASATSVFRLLSNTYNTKKASKKRLPGLENIIFN